MYVLVRLSQHVMSAQDTGSFLSMSFASALVQVKRNFDRFMQAQLKSIEETKVNRKSKCGLLPYVANFEVRAGDINALVGSTHDHSPHSTPHLVCSLQLWPILHFPCIGQPFLPATSFSSTAVKMETAS
jgi:hypothetical protein